MGGMKWLTPVILLAACRSGPAAPIPTDPAMKVILALRDAYIRKDMSAFMSHISSRYPKDIREALRQDFQESSVVSLDLWHEKTVDRFVEVRWEKRHEDRKTGHRVTGRGRTEFIFAQEDGVLRVVDQRGDPLFGWSGSDTDLTVESVMVALPEIQAIVANLGRNDAQNVRVRLSIDGVPTGKDQFVAVPGRGRATVVWSGAFPPGPGRTARVSVDPVNAIVETNELNNERDASY
jgi:hypothetical protein